METRTKCEDKKCPNHGTIKLRGRIFKGKVVSDKAKNTVKVEFQRLCYLPKYERYEKKRTRIQAHKPACIKVEEGDIVIISECRPISKTKNFVIIENESIKSKSK